jgi:hypothetical protein
MKAPSNVDDTCSRINAEKLTALANARRSAQFALPSGNMPPTAPADRFLVTQPLPIRSTLAAGNLGLYDAGNFFLTTGRSALPLASVIPQALWYFEDEPIAIAQAGLPIAGFARGASATQDVAAWAAQHSIGMPLEYPSLVWIAAPEMIRGARLVANGTRIEANGNTWAFDVVPKIALNRSYWRPDADRFS